MSAAGRLNDGANDAVRLIEAFSELVESPLGVKGVKQAPCLSGRGELKSP